MRITLHPSKPLVWWYNRRAQIDMAPPYQRRGRLWSESDKAYLVDSIINGFDVPKFYFADFQLGKSQLNEKKLPYAIIDGKQRLEAIFEFFDGVLVLNEDFVWRGDRSLKLGGLSLKDLRNGRYSVVAEAFETETVDIMSVVTDDEGDINELFVRLNRSKPLTGAEIRNAMFGPVADVIRNVARHPFFTDNIRFNTLRAGDYNAAAKVVLFEYSARPVNTKKKDLDLFASGASIDQSKLELAGRRTLDTLDNMQEVFLPKDILLSSAGPMPVYYWLIHESPFASQTYIREFIMWFEYERVLQRKAVGLTNNQIDFSFSKYDALSRSINDAGSHLGRFELLRSKLPQFEAMIASQPNLRVILKR